MNIFKAIAAILAAIGLTLTVVLMIPPLKAIEDYKAQDIHVMLKELAYFDMRDRDLEVNLSNRGKGPMLGIYERVNISNTKEIVSIDVVVVINYKFLKLLKTKDQLAIALGHELAHFYLKHTDQFGYGPQYPIVPQAQERLADSMGQWLAEKAGYDKCYASDLFVTLKKKYPNSDVQSDSHPSDSERINNLKCNKKLHNIIKDFLYNIKYKISMKG